MKFFSASYLLTFPVHKYISRMSDLPVIINALNMANNIETTKSTFNNKNKLSIINKLQTRQRYQVLKCRAFPKQPLLIINVSIVTIMDSIGSFNNNPIIKINTVSAMLKIMLLMKFFIFLFIFLLPFHLPILRLLGQKTRTNYSKVNPCYSPLFQVINNAYIIPKLIT